MLFVATLTVPANTPDTNPVAKKMTLKPGVIKRIEVLFPFGCNGLVKAWVKHGEIQIVPYNAEGRLQGSGEALGDNVYYEIPDEPAEITVYASSPGSAHEHTLYIRVWVYSPEQLWPELRLANILQQIAAALTARRLD